ncbi:EAL domain-containing protein [Altererythrobacter aerius]|uniref:EAL domain-containing protein n=1 Tax=Tsuneonella aeria TaxID=1837929 RepID=A0A6I4T828_9SPHN|nr:bifunctional diguanylate cyclase/phosphodiesterase [Tsuneonella aeria]MXO73729.1 EAL domain-containing protein [Tsuneonella aeria]
MPSFPQTIEIRRDALTGLADGATLTDTLDGWSVAPGERSSGVHAMLIGLSRFDSVNLAYGEAAGDGALVEVARRLLHLATDELERRDWVAARIGGGTFALVARQSMSRERWHWLGEALAEAVAAPIPAVDGAGTVRLWPRVALVRVLPGERAGHVLDSLAATLERAQDRAGARLAWADRAPCPPGVRAAQLDADLLAAIDRDEIEIVFQPQFALPGGGLIGAEALARWRHPTLGTMGASALFSIARRADHVAALSRHIAERALSAAAAWPGGLRLSLNITPDDLAANGFAAQFAAIVSRSGFDPARLTLEITEQVLLGNLEDVGATLGALKGAGMQIALDDFGGGFCNFRYLKLLPLDRIKLDRSMIDGIEVDQRDRAVLRAIVALATTLGLEVVAEGIETEAQRRAVADEGCTAFQGFLAARPLSPGDFLAFAR